MLLGGARRACCASPPPGARCSPAAGSPSPTPPPRPLARRLLDGGVVHPVPDGERARDRGDVTVVDPRQGPDRRRRAPARRASPGPGRGDRRRRRVGRSRRPRAPCTGPGQARTRVLRHDLARGPAAARNAGLAAATTPLVAFLDSDVLPSPAGSSRCSRTWPTRPSGWSRPGSSPWHRRVAGRHSRRCAAGSAGTRRCGRRWTWARTRPSSCRAPASPTSRARRCSCAARPSGRDSTSDMHVAEDVDLVLRLHAAGWRLRYEPSSRVAHEHRTGLRRVVAAQGVLRQRGGPARAAPPRRGAADGAQPVGGGGRPGCCWPAARSPPSAWPRGPCTAGPAAAGAVAPVPRGRPDHRARAPSAPSRQTADARQPPLLAAVRAGLRGLAAGPPGRRGRRAGRGRRRLAPPPRPRPLGAAGPVRPRRRAPARRPRLRRRAVVGCPAPPHPGAVAPAGPAVRDGRRSRARDS